MKKDSPTGGQAKIGKKDTTVSNSKGAVADKKVSPLVASVGKKSSNAGFLSKPAAAPVGAKAKLKEPLQAKKTAVAKRAESPKQPVQQRVPAKRVSTKSISKPAVAATLPAAVTKTAKASDSVPTVVPSGWYIQIAAVNDPAVADTLAGKLKLAGYGSEIQRALVSSVTYYRVLVGPYPNRSRAAKMLKNIKDSRLAKGVPFIKRVRN